MRDDLVGRLRLSDGMEVYVASDGINAIRANTGLLREAADEIERLRARLDECSNNLRLLAAENIRLVDQEEATDEV